MNSNIKLLVTNPMFYLLKRLNYPSSILKPKKPFLLLSLSTPIFFSLLEKDELSKKNLDSFESPATSYFPKSLPCVLWSSFFSLPPQNFHNHFIFLSLYLLLLCFVHGVHGQERVTPWKFAS